MQIINLPNEIWTHIAFFLDLHSLKKFKICCKLFYNIFKNSIAYLPLFNLKYENMRKIQKKSIHQCMKWTIYHKNIHIMKLLIEEILITSPNILLDNPLLKNCFFQLMKETTFSVSIEQKNMLNEYFQLYREYQIFN